MDGMRKLRRSNPADEVRENKKGFNEAIASKDILYRDRIELNDDDQNELDRRLQILKGMTYNGRMARVNRIKVTVVYYVPCADENSEAYDLRGRLWFLSRKCLRASMEQSICS